jgi:hypothetical protein
MDMSVIAIASRYIFAFGGFSYRQKSPAAAMIRKIDTYRLYKGWQTVQFSSPTHTPGAGYAVLPLKNYRDNWSSILVFGGYGKDYDEKDDNLVFSTDLGDFKCSTMEPLSKEGKNVCLTLADFFDHKRIFPISDSLLSPEFI